jgi:hypothetical protein
VPLTQELIAKREIFLSHDVHRTYNAYALSLFKKLEQDFRNHVRSPNCATRSGNWKALVNADGSGLELYDFSRSDLERENCAGREPRRACELSERLLAWRRSLSVLAPA